jgi:repressor LexA
METVYSEGVSTDPEPVGNLTMMGTSYMEIPTTCGPPARIREEPALIEPVFAMASSQHERLFGVKRFFERVFAFVSPPHYLHANRRSTGEGPWETASAAVARVPRSGGPSRGRRSTMAQVLSTKRKQILDCIADAVRDRGYPPSVREIGESVGLTSSSTVHAHLAVLQREGYLRRDPTKPRAMEVCYDPSSKVLADSRPIRHVPLVGEVAAGTGVLAQENIEELYPLPEDFTGTGTLFMVKVRGDSMIDAGIVDGDFVVVHQQTDAERGDIVVAGIPDGEATVKTFSTKDGKVILTPANERLSPMEFDPSEVTVYGKVVTVLRRL